MSAIRVETIDKLVPAVFGDDSATLAVKPMRGGLESAVAIVDFSSSGRRRRAVVKRLEGHARREVAVWRALAGNDFVPEMFGVAEDGAASYLFVEHVRAVKRWPWADEANTRTVVQRLARVHALGSATAGSIEDEAAWDYESALAASAIETVDVAERFRFQIPEARIGSSLRPLKRVAESLTETRLKLREAFGTTLLHGDAHPGNVVLRERGGQRQPLLVDWGRSRSGSPLEDLSSWLQTLRYWEPEAARRHDAFLRHYVTAAGWDVSVDSRFRDAYWIAAASNVLAGALRFHIVRTAELTGAARAKSAAQVCDALRIIRRADVSLRA